MNLNRIEKPFEELDWDKVDFENGVWTWCRGGHPYTDQEFGISYFLDEWDMPEVRYKVPECINVMLRNQYKYGCDSIKQEFSRFMRKMGE